MTIATMRRTLASLEADWVGLCDRYASACAPWPSWTGEHRGGLEDWAGRARGSDALAGCALRAAQEGDREAGRALLHLLIPRLVRLASRDPHHELSDYLATAWLRLMTYPVQTRPSALLTNLALDTLKQLSRTYERQHRPPPTGVEWLVPARSGGEGPRADGVLSAARAAGWLSGAHEPVLRSVYCDGLSGREAAERHQTSPEMVRYRCSAGVRALRAHRDELLLVA